MRTHEEIVARIKDSESQASLFNFEPDVLLPFLDFEHVKPFLKPEVTEELWNKDFIPATEEAILSQAKDYMASTGWDKVINHRGLSANRTIQKMAAWMWLMGNNALVAMCDDDMKYPMYGAPILAAICECYGWPIPAEPGIQNMIQGRKCVPDCEEGC
jgi:hypothetical protein